MFSCFGGLFTNAQENLPAMENPEILLAMEELGGKYLYICTEERDKYHGVRWIVHRIKMSDVLSSSGSRNLERVVDEISDGTNPLPSIVGSAVFRSKILIGGGSWGDMKSHFPVSKLVYSFEPDALGQKLEKKIFPQFLEGKSNPFLVEMKGKLYALPGDLMKLDYKVPFEKFDPDCEKWQKLNSPPIWDPKCKYYRHSSLAICSVITDTSILVSRGTTPVFRYDVTKADEDPKPETTSQDDYYADIRDEDFTNEDPKAGWCVQRSLCGGGSFPFRGQTLVHPCADGFIIFALDIERSITLDEYGTETPPTRFPLIQVYRMSQNYDTFDLLETVELGLPVQDHQLLLTFGQPFVHNCKFVSLGGQRVCLVLCSFGTTHGGSGVVADEDNLSFLVRSIEYKVEMPTFSYNYLGDPVILKHIFQRDPTYAAMLGAYLM